ncbi:DNA-binding response regulator, OmpR family, contains REC and winged-helix (wHTH) domain [Amycolatopsis xylanica]|uniref:DNA-binding response regulator, OmpR family, contains REC and winged-helix (WHTH) domain n=1 Tax=Amycolatopsis xylanica TaxID=589385 RepID=A0A1H3RD68_9PSEU|nr:response regulator transcription factor [Amycolatopsis xylanica]SDZ23596.1 DNA-binding response regulator, OmpR family, contains REC and winged-helix (wHTH) domain [Amycolatopsis xylanica]
MRLLVVEGEEEIEAIPVDGLRRSGHQVVAVTSGIRALEMQCETDMVLLDLGLADMSGLELCRRMRRACDTPIIAFTERRTETDRVLGLQAGADDCVDKPCGFWELTARIEAVMRRVRGQAELAEPLVVQGALRINTATRGVHLEGNAVEMTRKEFDLLHRLASEPGVVFSRRQLMAEIWGDPMTYTKGTKVSRTVDTHISVLRRKLGSTRWIRTVRGVGFSFAADSDVLSGR